MIIRRTISWRPRFTVDANTSQNFCTASSRLDSNLTHGSTDLRDELDGPRLSSPADTATSKGAWVTDRRGSVAWHLNKFVEMHAMTADNRRFTHGLPLRSAGPAVLVHQLQYGVATHILQAHGVLAGGCAALLGLKAYRGEHNPTDVLPSIAG